MLKTLLLDIDGVLLRDKNLQNHVNANCNRYVQKKLPDCKDPEQFYRKHGHTAVGLYKEFKIDTSDFNRFVYDKNLLEHLSEVIHGTEFQLEAKEIHSLFKYNWNISLFTNSPKMWATPVAIAISDEVNIAPKGGYLKPDPRAYAVLEKNSKYLYIDDSLCNLEPAKTMKHWTAVHFSESSTIHEVCELAHKHYVKL